MDKRLCFDLDNFFFFISPLVFCFCPTFVLGTLYDCPEFGSYDSLSRSRAGIMEFSPGVGC